MRQRLVGWHSDGNFIEHTFFLSLRDFSWRSTSCWLFFPIVCYSWSCGDDGHVLYVAVVVVVAILVAVVACLSMAAEDGQNDDVD